MICSLDQPFQALCLTGGGYSGLFTARALQVIKDYLGDSICRRFDLTCGMSIGSIVAIAVALEVLLSKVVKVFEEHGVAIFPPVACRSSSAMSCMWRATRRNLPIRRYESPSDGAVDVVLVGHQGKEHVRTNPC